MMTWLRQSFRLGVVLAVAVGLAPAAGAATIERIIVKSTVEGAQVSEQQVADTIGSKPGTTFDAKVLSDDMKALYRTGAYSDVLTDVADSGPDKVVITFKVTPKPKVHKITVEGNDRVKTKKLTKNLTQQEGVVFDEEKVFADAKAMRKIYQDKGYNQTEVSPAIEAVKDKNEVDVIFQIKEQARYKVSEVNFTGCKLYTERQLRKKMQTRFSFWSYIFPTGYFDESLLRTDLDVIYDAYAAKGYLDVKVTEDKGKRQIVGKRINLAFLIDEGQPYTVTSVTVTGNTRFTKEELMAQVKLLPGKPFDSDLERASVLGIRGRYETLGYVDLRVFPRHTLDSATHTVVVAIEIAEGIPSTIRGIFISGNEITKEKVIRRELVIQDGDLADAGKLRTSRQILMGMNYFESVDITPRATEKEDQKDIDIAVVEKPTGRLTLGVGVSSEDPVFGMIEMSQSNFDITNWRHPTGGGQRLLLRAQIGTRQQDVGVTFTEPWLFDQRLRLDLEVYLHQRDQDYYTQRNIGLQPMLTRQLKPSAPEGSEWQWWKHSVGVRAEQVTLSSFDDDVSQVIKDEAGSYTAVTLIYQIARDSRDRTINPTKGSRMSLSTEIEPEILGAYTTLYRFRAQGTKYIPLRRTVLKLDLEMGVVDTLSGPDPALFDEFFAGGTNSIRGFKRRAVGPTDEFDNPIGGQTLLRGTVEWVFPIYDMIRGSLFCDFGNVWADPYAFNPGEINVSVGPSLQLDLPIGPIRIAYGFPILVRQEGLSRSGQLHFDVGWNF